MNAPANGCAGRPQKSRTRNKYIGNNWARFEFFWYFQIRESVFKSEGELSEYSRERLTEGNWLSWQSEKFEIYYFFGSLE